MSVGLGSGSKPELTKPFDGVAPAGEDLRLDIAPSSLYFRLRDARAEARAEERLTDSDPTRSGVDAAHWKLVLDLATEALATRSKDIEIASWLTESLTRRNGLAGLADGTRIIAGLISNFWQAGLYPDGQAEDPSARLAAVGSLSGEDRDGSLLQPIRKTVLFALEDGIPVTFWLYERSRDLAALAASGQKLQRINSDVPLLDAVEASARASGRPALISLKREVVDALAAWSELEAVMAGMVAAAEIPSTGRMRSLLDQLLRTIERYVPEAVLASVPAEDDAGASPIAADPATTRRTAPAQDDASRDGMLDQVLRIAAAFRRQEPNSPFSYTLEDAVRRARLSWPELLGELMPDHAPRSAILSGLGIRPPPE